MRVLALLCLLFLARPSAAVLPVFEANVFYFSDAFGYSEATKSYGRTFWDIMVGMPLNKKGYWVLGWNYDSMSFTDTPGDTPETLTITDMGPKLMYYIDKERTWVIGLTYNLITKGAYNGGAETTEMRGTSLRAEFGYTPHMTENLLMGAKLNYYKASLIEEVINQTELVKTTNSRTAIYPVFTIVYRFE